MALPDAKTIEAYRRDGAVLIKGLWADWVGVIRDGIARNMAEPGPYAAENLKPGEAGRFFDDYCNWTRIPEFAAVIRQSKAAAVAAWHQSRQDKAPPPAPWRAVTPWSMEQHHIRPQPCPLRHV